MTKSISTKKRVAKKKQAAHAVGSVANKPLTDEQRQLIINHIPFAEHMGEHYAALGRSKGISKEELQQDARFALCEAALRFSPDRETDFQTYAYKWCLKYIMMSINRKDIGSDDDINTLEDDVPEDDGETQKERQLKVEAMMAVLNDQEVKVVRLLYGFGSTSSPQVDCDPKDFKDVAVIMNLHVGRVHQIYEKAMAKMEFGLSPAHSESGQPSKQAEGSHREGDVNPLNF